MRNQQTTEKRHPATVEARRLAELARAAGLGDSPDAALRSNSEALALLGIGDETPLLADVLRWHGSVLRDCGRLADAELLYRRSLHVSERLGYHAGRAHALNCLSSLAQRRGDLSAAERLLGDALLLADRCGEARLVGVIQQNLGIIADIRGNPAAALAHHLASLRTFEYSNDVQFTCAVLNNLGYLHVKEQRYDEARQAFDRALGLARARGDLMSEGVLEENRAELYLMLGELAEAYPCLTRALEVAETRRDDFRRAAALKMRGAYERMAGRPAESADTLRHALTLGAMSEDALLHAEVLYQFGLTLHDTGDVQIARKVWTVSLEAFERIAAPQWVERVRDRLSHGSSGRYL